MTLLPVGGLTPTGYLTVSAVGIGAICVTNVQESSTSAQCSATYSQPGSYEVSAKFSSTDVTSNAGPFDEQVGATSESYATYPSIDYDGSGNTSSCGGYLCSTYTAKLGPLAYPQPAQGTTADLGQVTLYYWNGTYWYGFATGTIEWSGSGEPSVQVIAGIPDPSFWQYKVTYNGGSYTDSVGEEIDLQSASSQ